MKRIAFYLWLLFFSLTLRLSRASLPAVHLRAKAIYGEILTTNRTLFAGLGW